MSEQVLRVAAGQVIIEEGSIGQHMFVLNSGAVEVSRSRGDMRMVFGRLGPGSLFGELGLLESVPRSATVTAVEDSEVICIDSAALLTRLAEDPMFGLKLLQRLSSKIRALSDELLSAAADTATDESGLEEKLTEIEYEIPGYL
jgi:CRP-like cAMP-binding protein